MGVKVNKQPQKGVAINTVQLDKFKQAAKDAGADEDEAAFEAKLKKLGQHKPEKEAKE